MASDEVERQLALTLRWAHAFTLTRLVGDQLDGLRARVLSLARFFALPIAGHTPDGLADAIQHDAELRTAAGMGLLGPLLDNWALGMAIAAIAPCLARQDGKDDDDDDATLARLHHLRHRIRTACRAHPRSLAVNALPFIYDDGDACNVLLPSTFPYTASASAQRAAFPSPDEPHPRPWYERTPSHKPIDWTPVFDHICQLKSANGCLSGDPAWDDALPPLSSKNRKRGQERWDWRLMHAIETCVANWESHEKELIQSDIGAPTVKMLALCDQKTIYTLTTDLITAFDKAASPAFTLATIFKPFIPQGPVQSFDDDEWQAQKVLFLQLYGTSTDFLVPAIEKDKPLSTSSIATTSSSSSAGTRTPSKTDGTAAELEALLHGTTTIQLDAHPFTTQAGTAAKQKNAAPLERDFEHALALARAAQTSRDKARTATCLPALGVVFRNEVMGALKVQARGAFGRATSEGAPPSSSGTKDGNEVDNKEEEEEKQSRKESDLHHAMAIWTTLHAQLSREAQADLHVGHLRARANAEAAAAAGPEGEAALEWGWSRGVGNGWDISVRDGWIPSPSSHASLDGKPGSVDDDNEERDVSAAQRAAQWLENEAGWLHGVLVDPGLSLNVAAALLKLGELSVRTVGDEDGEGSVGRSGQSYDDETDEKWERTEEEKRMKEVVSATTSALALLAQQRPQPPRPSQGHSNGHGQGSDKENNKDKKGPFSIPPSTSPAEVLDTYTFWIGGGAAFALWAHHHQHRGHSSDHQAGQIEDRYLMGAGYAVGCERAVRALWRARRLVRLRAGEGVLAAWEGGDGEEGQGEGEEGGEEEEEAVLRSWEENGDDEPVPDLLLLPSSAHTSSSPSDLNHAAQQQQQQQRRRRQERREAAKKRRVEMRQARGRVLRALARSLGGQLGLPTEDESCAGEVGEDAGTGTTRTEGIESNTATPTPTMPDNNLRPALLAPGSQTRTLPAWEALVWKALVRRGRARGRLLRLRLLEDRDEDEDEEGAGAGAGAGEEREQREEREERKRDVEELARLARRDLEQALALNSEPRAQDVPRAELRALEGVVGRLCLGGGRAGAGPGSQG